MKLKDFGNDYYIRYLISKENNWNNSHIIIISDSWSQKISQITIISDIQYQKNSIKGIHRWLLSLFLLHIIRLYQRGSFQKHKTQICKTFHSRSPDFLIILHNWNHIFYGTKNTITFQLHDFWTTPVKVHTQIFSTTSSAEEYDSATESLYERLWRRVAESI